MSTRFVRLAAPLAALLFALSSAPAQSSRLVAYGPPRLASRDLLADSLWDDGMAEVTTYAGTIVRYGQPRPLAARLIVVKEEMDVAQAVKSNGPANDDRTRTVLKQNYLQDFTTGTYAYHQMSTAFLDRETGALRKLAMASTEGCGVTFVEVLPGAGGWRHVSHSYWEGEADRDRVLVASDGTVAADALPLWLRRLDLARPQDIRIQLLPSQLSNRVQHAYFTSAAITVPGVADEHGLPVIVSFETSPDATGRTDRYWFDPAWPHTLVRFEGGNDPTVLTRVKTTRLAYWEKTAPGDEGLLEP